jgi:CheY-like chemotaxis protein
MPKPRIVLVHWKPEEAAARAAALRRAGYRVEVPDLAGGADLAALGRKPPAAIVIDLDRVPSRGRDAGAFLRQRRATRRIPLLFAGGAADKVARTREVLPDAVYAAWEGVAEALGRALDQPAAAPASPGVLAGYSGTPLPRKLGIKAGCAVALLGAPEGFEEELGELPEGVRFRRQARGPADVILLFAPSQAHLRRRFPSAARTLAAGGRLWICWPKQASGVATDLTGTRVRSFGLDAGFVDFKIAAIDATWSGLAFARRKSPAS